MPVNPESDPKDNEPEHPSSKPEPGTWLASARPGESYGNRTADSDGVGIKGAKKQNEMENPAS